MGRKITKKIIKITLIVLGCFLALDLILVGLLFVPPIQEKVVGVVAETLSEKWNSRITIGHIYLSPTLKLTVEDLVIRDHHDNSMIAAGKLKSRFTTLKFSPFKLGFSDIESDKIKVNIRKYKGDDAVNISIWAKNFKKKKKNPNPFEMKASSIILKNAYFIYHNDLTCSTKDKGDIDFGYFELKNIDARLDNFVLLGSNISADIEHLAFQQYTGFVLNNLCGKFHIGPDGLTLHNATLATPNSRVFLDFAFEYGSWQDYSDFLNKIKFNVKAKTSTFDMKDIRYFAPKTAGMDNRLVFSAQVNGPINHLVIKDLDARFADNTHLAGDLDIKNLTDFFNADIRAKLVQNEIDLREIQQFKLPGGKTIPIPEQVASLGVVTLDMEYAGVVSDKFDVDASLLTSAGDVDAQFSTRCHEADDGLDYAVTVAANRLSVPKLLPKVSMVGGVTGTVSAKGTVGDMNRLAETVSADIDANIAHVALKGYPLRNLKAKGKYAGKHLDADLALRDPNLNLALNGTMDLSGKISEYHAEGRIDSLNATALFAHLPLMDSTVTNGFDKLVRYVQLHPELTLSAQSLSCDLAGNTLSDLNGNVFIDSLLYNQDGKSLALDRLRLVSLANDHQQLMRLSSNLVNVSLITTCELADVPKALMNLVYTYCGNLFAERKTAEEFHYCDELDHSLSLKVDAYNLTPILDMFVPNIHIDNNTTLSVKTNESHSDDQIQFFSPGIRIGDKIVVNNANISSYQEDVKNLGINASVRSLVIGEKGNFSLENIDLNANMGPQTLHYRLNWKNPAVISAHRSLLAGVVNFAEDGSIRTKVDESEVYFKEFPFSFNQDHLVTIKDGNVQIDNLILTSKESQLKVDGKVGKANDSLVGIIDNLDVAVLNQFIKTDKMRLGGALSANVQMREMRGNNILLGTAIIRDFEFNEEQFGHLYANAILPSDKNIHFRGALINADYFPDSATVYNYKYSDLAHQQGVNTHLNGLYDSDLKQLKVTADIDTLPLGFLEPMLSSFSHKFEGNASGQIDFVLNKDSMYFEGVADVREAQIGIAPLNTFYNINHQKVKFTKNGFTFDQMVLTDQFGNKATMNGYVNHRNFSDFNLQLDISTPKIFVLNTKQQPDVPFYGDGFISGNITIAGDMEKLSFYGYDLSTQSGTVFCLPISFADKAHSSDVITFVVPEDVKSPVEEEQAPESSMEMDFDFIFNVTPAADIKLDLDLSAFGGRIKTKGEGQLHFTYNTKKDKINILGDVVLQSGSFIMTFAQLLNKKFELLPGGVVSFPGPINDINISVRAGYSTVASLADLFTSESTNVRRMPVKAYLNFNGNLNDPAAIDFSFDLPNATAGMRDLFYSTIDTTNMQKKTEQFFSLVMLGKFASPQSSITDINLENTGIGVLTSTLSNFISNQLKFVDVNFNYQNATADKAAEYAVGASTSLFNDRTVIETYVGYKDDKSSNFSNQFVGDFSVEQKLNALGTWRLKVFNVTNQDELRNATRNNPYAQGIAIIYKQDFNNRQDLIASFTRSKEGKVKKEKKEKKNRKNKKTTTKP